MTKITQVELEYELAKGKSIRQIAIDNGLNYPSLWKRCNRQDLRSSYRSDLERDKSEIQNIIKLYLAGNSVHEIGRQNNISGKVVWKILKKNGVERRKQGPVISINETEDLF